MLQDKDTLSVDKYIGTCAYMGGVFAVPEPFCWAWSQMIQYNDEFVTAPGTKIFYNRSMVSFHASARNGLVTQMRGDWLFMTDTDHVFEPDILARLLRLMNIHKVGVISGLYLYKSPPYNPTLYQYIPEIDGFNGIVKWDGTGELLGVDSTGGGCLLVKRWVYEKVMEETHHGPFDIEGPFGEDHCFYNRCRKLKIPTYAAVGVESHHLTMKALSYKKDFNIEGVEIDRKYSAEML